MATTRQFWISVVYFGAFTGLGLYLAAPGPILKDLQRQTDASLADISYVFSARAFGYILGTFIHGFIADNYTRNVKSKSMTFNKIWPIRPHHMFFLCILICNICMICLSFISSLVVLAITITISGVCFGGIEIYGSVCLLQLFDTNDKNDKLLAPYMNFLHFSFAVGAFSSPLLIQLSFILNNSYNIAMYIFAIWFMIFAVCLLFIDTPLRTQNDDIDNSENNGLLNNKQNIWSLSLIVSCSIFIGIYVGSEVAFGGYITTYSDDYLAFKTSNGRYISSVFWGGLAFGRLASVFIAKNVSAIKMLIADLIGCMVAMLLLIIIDLNVYIGWTSALLFGLFMASIYASIFVIAEKTVKISGKYASYIIFGQSCGEFIIPTLEGNIMSYFGVYYFAIFTLSTILALVVIVIIIMILKHQILSIKLKKATYGTV